MGSGNGEDFREWGSKNREDLPEEKIQVLGRILTGVMRECNRLIHTSVLGDDDEACMVAATMVIKFERFPGDESPFMCIGSLPDIPEVAFGLIEAAAEAMETVVPKENDGEE